MNPGSPDDPESERQSIANDWAFGVLGGGRVGISGPSLGSFSGMASISG